MRRLRQPRHGALTALVALSLLSWVTGCSQAGSSSGAGTAVARLDPGAIRQLVDDSGRFAFPAPRLAERVTIERAPSGGANVRFKVTYAVANPQGAGGAVADRAHVTLRVARSMFTTGPQPNDPVFSKVVADTELDGADVTRSYEVELPAEVHEALVSKGIDSGDADVRARALALVNVSVQQYRDFQVVDGQHDWIHGATFNAAQGPTRPADHPGGALTVRNDTATGIYGYDYSGLEPIGQRFGPGLFPNPKDFQLVTSESTGVSTALAGAAVSCFYQGNDGSNPEGFNVNLGPGAAVTQTIVADDSSVNLPNGSSEAAATADAIEVGLKVGVTALNIASSIAFGGPFTLVVALATNLLDLGEFCNNQPNVMQLGAVVENGQGASNTNWAVTDSCGGTCGGFSNYYTSPWQSSAPDSDADVINNAVQLAPDAEHTYQGQPLWLAQVPVQGCGIGNASDSNTSGCTSQNVISLRWTTEPACPWTNGYEEYNGSIVGGVSWCYLPAPTSPEVASCGTNNAECASYDPSGS